MTEQATKKVYVYKMDPPKGAVIHMDASVICFEVSFRTRDQEACAVFNVYHKANIEHVHRKLRERDFGIMMGKSEHRSIFCGSLDRLEHTMDELL